MKTFYCDSCGSLVFFENVKCLACGHVLGFLPAPGELSALEPAGNEAWRPLAPGQAGCLQRQCDNGRQHEVCNWLVPAGEPAAFCVSCRLNQVIPNLGVAGNVERWRKLEQAKRRVIYTILSLGLPLEDVPDQNRPGLRFNFVDKINGESEILTGHLDGVITINTAEADDAERERRRVELHEPYRTLLGHFRHEVGHYYWDRLIANSDWLRRFRQLFGDETASYPAALREYYQRSSIMDWPTGFVSAYASSHPWEDWAETWAHYFHILDLVETAGSLGLSFKPGHPVTKPKSRASASTSEGGETFDSVLGEWFPLTHMLNSLNRGMGLLDACPFVLSDQAIGKLRFIHEVVESSRTGGRAAEPAPAIKPASGDDEPLDARSPQPARLPATAPVPA